MKEYKQKAEQYVREQLPELMELSFGCEVEVRLLPNPEKNVHKLVADFTGDLKKNGLPKVASFFEVHEYGGLGGDCMTKIIGHPIQLQHWLRVLEQKVANKIAFIGDQISVYEEDEWEVIFNLTTGQPATEVDFKAFCDIVGI